jgi:hypothetical protein
MTRPVMFALAVLAAQCFTRVGCAEAMVVTKQSAIDGPISFKPRFMNGYLIHWNVESAAITWYTSLGELVRRTTLRLPGVERCIVRDATANVDGTLVIAASAYSISGQPASVLVWLNKEGSVNRVVRTSPFASLHITTDSTGVLWAIGRVHDSDYRATAQHDVIRQYSEDGTLIRTFFPSTGFSWSGPRHATEECTFVPSGRGMGLYCALTNEWIEFSSTGEVLNRRQVPAIQGTKVAGVASANDSVFLSLRRSPAKGPVEGNRLWYRLETASGALTQIDVPSGPSGTSVGYLIGAEGGQLVAFAGQTVSWVH